MESLDIDSAPHMHSAPGPQSTSRSTNLQSTQLEGSLIGKAHGREEKRSSAFLLSSHPAHSSFPVTIPTYPSLISLLIPLPLPLSLSPVSSLSLVISSSSILYSLFLSLWEQAVQNTGMALVEGNEVLVDSSLSHFAWRIGTTLNLFPMSMALFQSSVPGIPLKRSYSRYLDLFHC
jgi:hypothetical protein